VENMEDGKITTFDFYGDVVHLSEKDMFVVNDGTYRDCLSSRFDIIMGRNLTHDYLFTNGKEYDDIYCHLEPIDFPISANQYGRIQVLVFTHYGNEVACNVFDDYINEHKIMLINIKNSSQKTFSVKINCTRHVDEMDIFEAIMSSGKCEEKFAMNLSKVLSRFIIHWRNVGY